MSSLAAMGHGPHGPVMHPAHPPPPPSSLAGVPPPPPPPQLAQTQSVLGAGHHVQLSHLSPHLSRMSPQSLATMPPQLSSSNATPSSSSSAVVTASMSSAAAIANALAPTSMPTNAAGMRTALSPLVTVMSGGLPPPPLTTLPAAASVGAHNSPPTPPTRATQPTNLEQSPQNLTTTNDASSEAMHIAGGDGVSVGVGGAGGGNNKCNASGMELLDVGRDSPPPSHALSNNNSSTNPISRQSPISANQPQTADIRSNSIATLRIKAKEHLESINKGLAMV
ncbi:unnamed protein product [Ceratitis capitata]|uniref:(Mediterranean fruit fly) hypothetical protein n=3 Tax=Ceratitis capitata TaxID=7213 RepID=A0A811VFR5_CERCA|nr:unnamed protein product [Ceratitis capitata]